MKRTTLVLSCCASLMVSACGGLFGGGDSDGETPTTPVVNPNAITVTGKVFDALDTPALDVSILIPGDGRQVVRPDGSGGFSISGVTPPYDIIVANTKTHFASVYKGLTLKTLTLRPDFSEDGNRREGSLSGKVTGAQTSSGARTEVMFASPNLGSGTADVDASGAYAVNVEWRGPTSTTGALYALQMQGGNYDTPPTSYLAFGQRDATLAEYNARDGQDLTLSAVKTTRLAGSVTVPAGYTLGLIELRLAPKPAHEFDVFHDSTAKSTFDYPVPELPQGSVTLVAYARESSSATSGDKVDLTFYKRGLKAGTTNVAWSLTPAPRPAQPADGAKNVARAVELSWSAAPQSMHRLLVASDEDDTAAPYFVSIFTAESRTTLPDLSAFGMAPSAGSAMSWMVEGMGPATSMDALMGMLEKGDPALTSGEDYQLSTSEIRSFTLAR